MATLCVYGHVQPSEYSPRVRRRGLTWREALRLQHEIMKIRKVELDLQFTLAKIRAGLPLR